jgi:DNA invertase Pin-like site-specific DNA recombinase
MTIFGYARGSISSPTLNADLEALKAAGCKEIFRENVSGPNADRAQLARLLAAIGQGDMLIVSRLDRLARSTRDLLNILDRVAERGASFRSLGESWADTTTPQGRLMLPVLRGLAEFERGLIRARTGEGWGGHPSSRLLSGRRHCRRWPAAQQRRPIWCAVSMSAKARFHGWRINRRPCPALPRP